MQKFYCKFRVNTKFYERFFTEEWQIEDVLQSNFIKFKKDSSFVQTDFVYIPTNQIDSVEVTIQA
jgi:hypothetical protein